MYKQILHNIRIIINNPTLIMWDVLVPRRVLVVPGAIFHEMANKHLTYILMEEKENIYSIREQRNHKYILVP